MNIGDTQVFNGVTQYYTGTGWTSNPDLTNYGGRDMSVVPVLFTDDLATQIGGPGIGQAPGECPMRPDGACGSTDGCFIAPENGRWQCPAPSGNCNIIRECDPYTGAVHMQYNIGSIVPNANIWTVDSSGGWQWQGANGMPTTPPNWAAPPTPAGPGIYNSPYTARLEQVTMPGMRYDPGAGWVPTSGSIAPTLTPTIPAYTSGANVAGTAPVSDVPGTASGSGPSVGGSNSSNPTGIPGVGQPLPGRYPQPGPYTGEVQQTAKNSGLMMLAVVGVLVVLAMKG